MTKYAVYEDDQVFLENGAMNQIISVGLKDIENDSIRTILASWDGKIDRVRIQEQQMKRTAY
jgi:hypothetical protein